MLMLGLISQDKALSEAVLEQMKQAEGWQCTLFETPQAAQEIWKTAFPSLVLWDAESGTPDSAASFYSFFKESENKPWLLVIGPPPFDYEETDALEFLVKPLRLGKLLSRLQFYKRRLQQPPDTVFPLGPFVFYPRRNRLEEQKTKEETKLTDKETALLEYLASAQEPIFRDQLLEEVWGYGTQIDTHTLETHIYRLRQKLMALNPEGEDCFFVQQGRYAISKAWITT